MNRAAEGTLAIGGAIKGLVLSLGGLAVFGYAIYLLATGHIVAGLALMFIGEPIMFMIADIATGLILAAVVAIAGFLGWSLKRREADVDAPSAWTSE